MDGLRLAVGIVAAIAVLGLPGAAIGLVLRMRGLWLAAAAPVIGVAVTAVASMIASFVGVPWSIWPVVVIALLGCAIGWPIGTRLRRTALPAPADSWRWASLVAVFAGVVLLALRTLRVLPSPRLIAQSFDNVFHLNAVRFILDTGRASPWDISTIARPAGEQFFYPNAWHASVALVAQASGASVPIASNATLIVVACLVWPLGSVLLSRTLFGSGSALLVSAGIFSAGLAASPYMLIAYMGTYPLMLSIALLPVAIAAAVVLAGIGDRRVPLCTAALVLASAIPALGTAHPSSLVMLAILTVPLAALAVVRLVATHPERRSRLFLALFTYIVGVCILVLLARPNFEQPDSLRTTTAQALGEIALGAYGGKQVAIVAGAATITGIVVALRRRSASDWAAVAMWASLGSLYLAAVGPDDFLRLLFGGPWYSDATRIAAFAPVVLIPLAALGAGTAWMWFSRLLRRHTLGRAPLRVITTAVAIMALATAVASSAPVRWADSGLRGAFKPTSNPFVSHVGVGPDEHELIRLIEEEVPDEDVIANNPRDGSGFVYALTGRQVLAPHMLMKLDDDREVFYGGIADADPIDPACEIARRLDVRWVVEFHPDKVLSVDGRFDGLKDIAASPNVKVAHKIGDSTLYRITGCGFADE